MDGWSGIRNRIGGVRWLVALSVVGACSDDPPPGSDESSGAPATSSTTTEVVTSVPEDSTGASETSSSSDSGSTTTASADSTSTGVDPICGDDMQMPGELCFLPSVAISLSPTSALALADLDGNGVIDILAGHYDSISVHLGHGDGTFEMQVHYPISNTRVHGITSGDFDGDLDVDVAAASSYTADGALGVRLGNGDGTLADEVLLPLTGTGATGVVAADFDDDGDVDLAVTLRESNRVDVFAGQGDGTFVFDESLETAYEPWGIVAADFDGAGPLDLAVSNTSGDTVDVYLASPTAISRVDGFFYVPRPIALVARDFDDDGLTDVATLDWFDGAVSALRGTGQGMLEDALVDPVYIGGMARAIAAGDFDGDGQWDLVVPLDSSSQVQILRSNQPGIVSFSVGDSIGTVNVPESAAVGDLDGDGTDDFVIGGNISMGGIGVHLNDA
jgi:hypothetical protein